MSDASPAANNTFMKSQRWLSSWAQVAQSLSALLQYEWNLRASLRYCASVTGRTATRSRADRPRTGRLLATSDAASNARCWARAAAAVLRRRGAAAGRRLGAIGGWRRKRRRAGAGLHGGTALGVRSSLPGEPAQAATRERVRGIELGRDPAHVDATPCGEAQSSQFPKRSPKVD